MIEITNTGTALLWRVKVHLLDICQPGEVWSEVETDPERGALQGDSSDEQDDQDHVGEGGGDVNHLPARFDALDETAKYDDPSRHQTKGQLPIRSPKISSLDTGTFLQDFLIEILSRTGFSQGDRNVKQCLDGILGSRSFVAVTDVGEDAGNHSLASIDLHLFLTLVPVGKVTTDDVQSSLVLYTGPEMTRGLLKMTPALVTIKSPVEVNNIVCDVLSSPVQSELLALLEPGERETFLVVVVIVAVLPRQGGGEGGEEVVDGPGDDHVVVETDESLSDEVDESQSFENGTQVAENKLSSTPC